jgi:hypothetical protein
MNISRERLFGIIVGCTAVVLGGFFIQQWVSGQFSRRAGEIGRLKQDIQKFERDAAKGRVASRKVADYELRSLPANVEIARSRYQTWLVNEMELAGLIEPDVRFTSAQGGDKDIFVRQAFSVEANGTLPQVVELLYGFYRVDWLHRITQLKLRPVSDSKLLNFSMHIEALSLKKAASVDKLEPRESSRLALKERDAYYDAIVGRNIFGPRNNEPKLEVSGPTEVYLGRTAELTIKGNDPDPLDQVFMNLVQSAAEDAKLDPVTGKLIWTPKTPGTYEFVVQGTDDGFPALQSKPEKLVVTVKEQKPPAPKGLEFDVAKFTILTSILSVSGQGEIWLHVRPTGQIVMLREGDKFEIGSIKGTVSQIGEYDFTFDFEGKRRKLAKGEFLEQAKVISDSPTIPASTPVSDASQKRS